MRTKTLVTSVVILSLVAVLASCGGDSSGPDTSSCPNWNLGDSTMYKRTVTVSGVPTETTMTYVVTERTTDSVTLSDGTTTKKYSIVNGKYIPVSEQVLTEPADNYTSTTAFCPPPAVGEIYEYTTFVPGPDPRSGDNITTTLSVTGVTIESVSVPAGSFTAKKLVMEKISLMGTTPWLISTVTRYYVAGIGVVKEVEEIPSENTTITDELTSYSFQQ